MMGQGNGDIENMEMEWGYENEGYGDHEDGEMGNMGLGWCI